VNKAKPVENLQTVKVARGGFFSEPANEESLFHPSVHTLVDDPLLD
jgi:hypothetical protein